MSLQVKLALEGNLAKFTKDVSDKVRAASYYAVVAFATRLKLELRDDTRAGGLGDRVANAWQQKSYNNAGASPAALVYSKAPLIVTAFSGNATIVPHGGHLWLAIPTDNVPGIGRHKMTPAEVEIRFNQDLIIVPARRSGTAYAFVNAIAAKNGKGFRPPTKGRLKQGRNVKRILMFVLVKQVRLSKRLRWPEVMEATQEAFQDFLGDEINKALSD